VRALVVDFEATCSPCRVVVPRDAMEIIEIGAVLLDATGAADADRGEFRVHVRPQLNPMLTPFCTELTGITQADVDAAPTFPDALAQLLAFAGDAAATCFMSFGGFDARLLAEECARHGVQPPPFASRLNLKRAVMARLRIERPLGIVEALERCGLRYEGRLHSALDDARNASRLASWLAAH
jgi:3'-5' exoribonuclease 1